jgi:GxxExxY protein
MVPALRRATHGPILAQDHPRYGVTINETSVLKKCLTNGTHIEADIIVEDRVIVEIKTVENIDRIHEAQLLNYMKATGIQVGLLVNFKHPKADIKRMVLNLCEEHDI